MTWKFSGALREGKNILVTISNGGEEKTLQYGRGKLTAAKWKAWVKREVKIYLTYLNLAHSAEDISNEIKPT